MQKIIKRPDGSIDVQEIPEGKSLTQQQFKDECDVNSIMRRYMQTGVITHTDSRSGVYADITELPASYQEALDVVRYANEAFMQLDAQVRNKFNNDPQAMIDFLNDPTKIDESISLGLREIEPNPLADQSKMIAEAILKSQNPTPPISKPL
ncbi:MAG: internal scaffolding protein [Microvirus sp.]|nr:MAG: internal scaffolding protein [Microvirus sp.]